MDLRALMPYVAQDRRHVSESDTTALTRPSGASLFADIVGFTPLTNAFSRGLGARRGAEALTHHLNVVYDTVIGEVDRFRGSVIDFSGDAIGCWFDDDDDGDDHGGDRHDSGSGARRAVTAAMAMAEAMRSLPPVELPDGGTVQMSLKVAVATGPAIRTACGDPSVRRFDVLGGPCVDRMAAAEKVAAQGDVVLDESVLDGLSAELELHERREAAGGRWVGVLRRTSRPAAPDPWPEPAGAPVDAGIWLDHRIRARQDDEVTELRSAVALFVRLGALDFAADDAGRRLDSLVRTVQGVLAAYDGNLIQVTVGDKGNYLYVAFGAPTAHEDVADRAVGAALELRDVLQRSGTTEPPSFGIDQGIARVGAYGGLTRRTYGVLGDGTNMAARLMSAARPGEILVTDTVRNATRERLTFETLAPIRVKGRDDAVAVARLIGRPVGTGARTFGELVGRHREYEQLLSTVLAVTDGPAGAVLVEGEPGVGKSHLVEAVRRGIAERADVTWLSVGADGVRRGPLVPFLPILRDLFYQELADDDQARHDLFDHVIESRLAELGGLDHRLAPVLAEAIDADRSYVAALLGLRRPDTPFERHDPSTRLAKCIEAVDSFFRSESICRPVVIHVRDAHLLDQHSDRLLDRLVRSTDTFPMCLVVDRRPVDRTLVPADRCISLGDIDRDDLSLMIEVLAGAPPSTALCDHIWAQTSGNALFVEQLVIDLERRGAIVVGEDGTAELLAIGHELPPTLDAVLLSRLDHLDPPVRRAVQAASVLGTTFDQEVLGGILARANRRADGAPPGPDPIDELIAGAERAGVWSATSDGRTMFRHALLRDAAYHMQVADIRKQWHRLAARVVTQRTGRGAPEIAAHLEWAGDAGRAAAAYRRTAREAWATGRRRESLERSISAIAQARLAACSAATMLGLHDGVATIAAEIGEHALAIEQLESILAVADAHPELAGDRRVRWRAALGESLHRLGRIAAAEEAFEAALGDLQDHPQMEIASQIYAGLAMVHLQQGELDDAFELAQMASVFGDGLDVAETRAHHHLGVIQWHRGEYDDALAHDTEALARCERRGDVRGRAAVLNNIGLVRASLGRPDAALDAFRQAVRDFERTGNEHGLACAADNLAKLLMEHGAEEEAMQHLERAVEILARIGIGPDGVVAAMWQSGSW